MTKTPEAIEAEKKAAAAARKEAAEKKANEDAAIRLALNGVENPNVRYVLQYIMRLSGFHSNPVVIGPDGDVKRGSLEYNVGRESVYHDLRKLMTAETKNIVERSE
jgi:hypothetical protein